MRIKTFSFSLLAVAVVFSGCGSSDSSLTSTNSATGTTLNGKAVDGYLSGATVCFDTNDNATCDTGEPTSTTDANGSFTLKTDKAIAQNVAIIAYGGVDTATNKPFLGILKASKENTSITPLTTLLCELEKTLTKEKALLRVAEIAGVDKELVTKDPVALKDSNPELIKANLAIAKLSEATALGNDTLNKENVLAGYKNLATAAKDVNTLNNAIEKLTQNSNTQESLKSFVEIIKNENFDNLTQASANIELAKEKVALSVKNNKVFTKEEFNTLKQECSINATLDDSTYKDTPPNNAENIPFTSTGTTVSDIKAAFDYARSKDTTITKELIMPSQEVWDAMGKEEQALYILNRERVDRGLKPFEGVVQMQKSFSGTYTTIADVAAGYAQTLYGKTTLLHDFDGTPTERINRVESIKENKENIPYNENLYAEGNSFMLDTIPLVRAIYNWIYADANPASGEAWGHRAMCLMKVDNDNFGIKGAEGILGFALKQGEAYAMYPDFKSSIVVLNAFNPTASWSGKYKKTTLCYGINSADGDFERKLNGVIVDKTTTLTWQNSALVQKNKADAQSYCSSLEFGGYDDWRLPNASELSTYYTNALKAGVTPNMAQANSNLLVASNGFVFTTEGAKKYNKTPGGITNDFGETTTAEVHCVRGEAKEPNKPATLTKGDITLNTTTQTITDTANHKEYLNNTSLAGKYGINYAKIVCNNLTFGDKTNWRLPTPSELSMLHKEAKEQNATLNYHAGYCTYEITNEATQDGAKAIRVQKASDTIAIGDIVNFKGSAGVRCVRDTTTQESNTIPPSRPKVRYDNSDKKALEVLDEEELSARSYLGIDTDTTCDDTYTTYPNGRKKYEYSVCNREVTFTIEGLAQSKLYTLGSKGELEKELGTLSQEGTLEITLPQDTHYKRYKNSDGSIKYYSHSTEYVLVDENENISKINRVFVQLYPQGE